MDRQGIWIVAARDEITLANQLVQPLQDAGYEVQHEAAVLVGDSIVGAATDAVARQLPIVLCATPRSIGNSWTHAVVNASRASGRPRVFVVQMDSSAYVEQLGLQTRVARYDLDPAGAIEDLLTALRTHYPPVTTRIAAVQQVPVARHFLDEPTGLGAQHVDVEALQRFREALRDEFAADYPQSMTPWEWLAKATI